MANEAKSIERIAREALELESDDARRVHLDVACAGDSTLRKRVESRVRELAEHTATEVEAATIDPAPAAARAAGPARGDRVGRYRLIEIMGEGGFGVVWRAEQTQPVRRQVALKLIKPGMDSRGVLARFEAERQALALMDHPCVARVFDGGVTDRGAPFFAMELVRGLPITDHCDRHRLGLDERIELFIRVCEAVQHAHSKGVIHRDLKPSNILVEYEDGRSTPKVIDFGVAKALSQRLTEATIFTEQGQLIGTPDYMSPEQAEMSAQDVDTRSDVYSLGVLLYELLAGSRPFEAETLRRAGLAEIQRIIREVDPPKPSTRLHSLASAGSDAGPAARIAHARRTQPGSLTSVLRRDLDWVVVRCLEKDRERRYQTPSALATDLRRYLNDEPLLAGPPTVHYRVAKFVKRNRGAVVAGALLLATLLLGVAGTTTGWVRAMAQRQIARAEADAAERAREEAQAVTGFLIDDLLGALEDLNGSGPETTVREVVDAAREQLLSESRPGGRLEGRGSVQFRLALTIGRTYAMLTVHEPALAMLKHARDMLDAADEPEEWISVTLDISLVYEDLGSYRDAEREARAALDLASERLGRDDEWTLESQSILALTLYDQDRYSEAEALYRDELARRRASAGYTEADEQATLNNLAILLSDTGRYAEAAELLERDLAISERIGHHASQTLTTRSNLALVYRDLGETERAAELLRGIERESRERLGPAHSDTILSIWNRAGVEFDLGNTAEAIALLEEAVDKHRAQFGPYDPYTVLSACDLIECLLEAGDDTRAGAVLGEIDAAPDALLARRDADGLDAAGRLADTRWLLGQRERAMRLSGRVWEQRRAIFEPHRPASVAGAVRHARLLLEAGRPGEAGEVLPAETLVQDLQSFPDAELASEVLALETEALSTLERFPEAEALLTRAARHGAEAGEPGRAAAALLAELYERWHEVEPARGYGEKAAQWRAILGNPDGAQRSFDRPGVRGDDGQGG